MTITFGKNIASLTAQRRLRESTDALARTFERLSSGQRINRASDDAASLAIADSLKIESKLYSQAIRNANDGLSMLNIAEGALNQLSEIVTRISELAEQAANGVYTSAQRSALQSESQALSAEYNRIIASTKYNGVNILNGVSQSLQVGINGSTQSQLQLNMSAVSELGEDITTVTGDGTFASEANLQSGSGTQVITYDFNGDGELDLGISNDSANTFGIKLGNGDGTFKALTSASIGVNTERWLETKLGDVNSDGIADVVIGAGTSNMVSVIIGNNNGTFKAPVLYTSAAGLAGDLELGDFNSDGILDIIGQDYPNGLSLLIGNADGTFKLGTFIASASTTDLASGDINNDGKIDIFLSGSGRVALSNGDGTFSMTTAAALSADRGPVLADLNGDGKLDVSAWSPGGAISYALGNGDGSFKARTNLTTGTMGFGERQLTVADIDGDGDLDFIAAESTASALGVFIGNGDGTFKARVAYAESTASVSTTVGDFNGDGAPDIVSVGSATDIFLGVAISSTTLQSINLTTASDALSALTRMTTLRESLSQSLSSIGALQSRIGTILEFSSKTAEESKAAESRIRDADIALESATLIRQQILQNAASAILAQANLQPRLALLLLQ